MNDLPKTQLEMEAEAWRWLLSLKRLNLDEWGVEETLNQIQIQVLPGNLGEISGASGITISILHPESETRLQGEENSLADACNDLRVKCQMAKLEMPMLWIL